MEAISQPLKLYKALCGFHEQDIAKGLYECHEQFYTCAPSAKQAVSNITNTFPVVKDKNLHFDALEEINQIDDFTIILKPASTIKHQRNKSVAWYGGDYFHGRKEIAHPEMKKDYLKFFCVHFGFYDQDFRNGFYEFHVDFYIVANNVMGAVKKVKQEKDYKKSKMHIDGIQWISQVGEYDIEFKKTSEKVENVIYNYKQLKQYEMMQRKSGVKLFKGLLGFHSHGGLYESHTQYYIGAKNHSDAVQKITKTYPAVKKKMMHFDGIEELISIDNYLINLDPIENDGLLKINVYTIGNGNEEREAVWNKGKRVYGMNYQTGTKAVDEPAFKNDDLKLFVAHCGYNDPNIRQGIHEFQCDFYAVATNLKDAIDRIHQYKEWGEKNLHIDGIAWIEQVPGFRIVIQQSTGSQIKNQTLGFDDTLKLYHPYEKNDWEEEEGPGQIFKDIQTVALLAKETNSKLVVYDDIVYDVTEFASSHPGGEALIDAYVGKDIKHVFESADVHQHSKAAFSMLMLYKYGTIQK